MLREVLKKEIEKAVEKFFDKKADFSVEAPANSEHGDYSSNAAMVLTGKALRKPLAFAKPPDIAQKIKSELEKSEGIKKHFEKIEIAPPGFLNFWLSESALTQGLKELKDILSQGFVKKKEKISLDYLDANPTGPVHLGHARSGFFGDALSNILEFSGHRVSREFYVNNARASAQIQSLGKTALGQGEEYKHNQLLSILKKPEVKKKLEGLSDEKEAGFYIAGLIQKENQKFLEEKAKIKFDLFFEEESVYSSGLLEGVLEGLKKAGAVYEKDGALWFRAKKFGDAEDRVLVRSTGEPTYFVPDLAYHWDRLVLRKNDWAINIFGADHHGYGPRLKGALKALGIEPERIKILISQTVRLAEKGREVKMSKRKGIFVSLEDLISEIGLDAARFFFLMKSLGVHMDFDLGLAKERSEKNPVYYIQYAGARMQSIIEKSKISPRQKSAGQENQNLLKFLSKQEEKSIFLLVKKLIQFPEAIEDISKDYQVHRLTGYACELAYAFSIFYRDVRVLGAGEKEEARLALVFLARRTLEKCLSLLGVSAPDKM